jgi:hypothetical protein
MIAQVLSNEDRIFCFTIAAAIRQLLEVVVVEDRNELKG